MTYRGTTNRNDRGNTVARRKRRQALVERYRADVDLYPVDVEGQGRIWCRVPIGDGQPACRCYRCGTLLTEDTVTCDRMQLGVEGGTYDPANVRPACLSCNSKTGGKVGAARRAAKRQAVSA